MRTKNTNLATVQEISDIEFLLISTAIWFSWIKTLGKICIMSAIELILNNDHLKCSPDDILRIGFIFGQRTASGLG